MPIPTITDMKRIPEEIPFTDWLGVLDSLPKYSYFQSPAWCNIITACHSHVQANHLFITFDDHVQCVVPGFVSSKKMGFRKFESLPWGTYGSPFGEGVTAKHVNKIGHALTSFTQPVASFILHPSYYGEINLDDTGTKNIKTFYTHILHLNQPFEDIVNQRFQSRLRTTLRKTSRSGVSVYWSNESTAVTHCKHLYARACEQWGNELTVPVSFFDTLIHKPEQDIRIWLAEYNGIIIAFDVMLYGKSEVQYFTGAKDTGYDELNAPKLIMNAVIQDACERGFGLINFGASAGLKGVEQFKERFGGIKSYYAQLTYCHFAFRIFQRFR